MSRNRGDAITLGFDGSRKRHDAATDATALVGVTVDGGHVFVPEVGGAATVWEAPPGEGRGWEIPAGEVDAAVREVLGRFNVVGFFCDPTKWESYVSMWESEFGDRMRVKASQDHPFTWWPGPKKITRAVEEFHAAVVAGELSHDGSPILRRHVLNARRRPNTYGITIGKEHPSSDRKIDAVMAAVQAWQARSDVLSKPRRRTGRMVAG